MIWETLIESAKRAPSPHNTQPWLLQVRSDTTADLFIVGERTLPREDLTGSFLLSAMSIFVVTLQEVARAYGYELSHTLKAIPDPNIPKEKIPFGHLRLSPLPESNRTLPYPLELIQERKTSRLPNLRKAVPLEIQAELIEFCEKHGQRFEILSERQQIDWVLARNTTALFEDLNTPDYHDELIEWLRVTKRQALENHDGLDRTAMRLSSTSIRLMVHFPRLLETPPFHTLFRHYYRHQLGHAEHIGIVSGPFWEPEESLKAGSFLGLFWLELARHDLRIHPFGNLVTNPSANRDVTARFSSTPPWFVFRLGYTENPPESLRLPNTSLLQYENTT